MPGLPIPGPIELIIILVIALLILGPGKLPEVGSAVGKTLREFRRASSDIEEAADLNRPVARRETVVAAPATTASVESVDDPVGADQAQQRRTTAPPLADER